MNVIIFRLRAQPVLPIFLSQCLRNPGCGRCEECSPGSHISIRGSTRSCDGCPKTTFSPKPGSSACEPCPKGTYSLQLNASHCPPCPKHYYCPVRKSGTVFCCLSALGTVFFLQSPGEMHPCPEASFCPAGSFQPVQCHGPVMTVDIVSKHCVVSPEFLTVVIVSVISTCCH